MHNFSIHFSYPWLLLLLIPAAALTLIPYFRLSKRYRRTRNRIVSVVLHLCVTVLCVSILCGIEFRYTKTNTQNEIILLIDVSDTEERAGEKRDEFVRTVLDDGRYDGYKIGVVTFGFTQQYAVEMTYDVDGIYDRYKAAPLPDTSATDIASALKYTKELFTHPESSKVVLITDGKETDGNALGAIRTLTAQGTIVDSAYIFEDFSGNDVQVTEIKYPETHVKPNTECTVTVTVRSRLQATSASGGAETAFTRVELTDNGERTMGDADVKTLALTQGENVIPFNHTFTSSGLHEIKVTLSDATDDLDKNNVFTSYIFLDSYNKVLVVEKNSEESQNLIALLQENGYETDRVNLSATTDALATEKGVALQSADDLRRFDQIIMNNIANKNMQPHEGFVDMLYSYVYDYGGGLFTVGGDDETGKANAYSRTDLWNTKYQEILPVQAIEYTPPVGLVVLVDRSGSMDENLEYARQGLISCANALTERDYIGVMTLDTVPNPILPLTPRTHINEIMEAFEHDDLKNAGGGTQFFNSIQRAGEALMTNKQVEKRHIIIVSDGMPNDIVSESDGVAESPYITEARELHKKGITLSVILIT
ncbi:MAG: VWA domain-containing protein, partial [Candidatus Scatosoma sp.]